MTYVPYSNEWKRKQLHVLQFVYAQFFYSREVKKVQRVITQCATRNNNATRERDNNTILYHRQPNEKLSRKTSTNTTLLASWFAILPLKERWKHQPFFSTFFSCAYTVSTRSHRFRLVVYQRHTLEFNTMHFTLLSMTWEGAMNGRGRSFPEERYGDALWGRLQILSQNG